MKLRFTLLAAAAVLCLAGSAFAQQRADLDAAGRTRAMDAALRRLREGYVFPEVAEKMEKRVRERAAAGAYDGVRDGERFAAVLTEDLRSVSRDRHIRVRYSASVLPPEPSLPAHLVPALSEEERQGMARDNYGIGKLDILKGNVGLLQLRYLAPPQAAGDTYVAAMNYLAHTDALIIDLRTCTGSISPDAIPMLCSYFFAAPTHLNDIYWRGDGTTRQFWTSAQVFGKRYLGKPIYVLTSRNTFSGAEELAYDLQQLKRATVVGETTGGGANPGGDRRADDHFTIWVPVGRAINPITGTNWEGVGVTPDVKAPFLSALHQAHLLALKFARTTTADALWKEQLARAIADVERSTPRTRKVRFTLKGHPSATEVQLAGSFNAWTPAATPLTRQGDAWVGEVEAEVGRNTYKFVVDGEWMTDPANPVTEGDGEYVNSVRMVE